MPTYKRVLIKLSGGALAGGASSTIDRVAVDQLVDEIVSVTEQGTQVAIMVGGGNIFRGRLADEWGIERAEADAIGMMATVVNSLMLRGAITARGGHEVRVMTAIPMAAVAEPYVRLRAAKHLDKGYVVIYAAGTGQPYVTTDYPAVQRAIETRTEIILAAKQGVNGVFSADPLKHPDANRFTTLSYEDVIDKQLNVMDQAAFILARDHAMPLHIFDANEVGAMRKICNGEADGIGTYIGPDAVTKVEEPIALTDSTSH